jgi:hypothetical protein
MLEFRHYPPQMEINKKFSKKTLENFLFQKLSTVLLAKYCNIV